MLSSPCIFSWVNRKPWAWAFSLHKVLPNWCSSRTILCWGIHSSFDSWLVPVHGFNSKAWRAKSFRRKSSLTCFVFEAEVPIFKLPEQNSYDSFRHWWFIFHCTYSSRSSGSFQRLFLKKSCNSTLVVHFSVKDIHSIKCFNDSRQRVRPFIPPRLYRFSSHALLFSV